MLRRSALAVLVVGLCVFGLASGNSFGWQGYIATICSCVMVCSFVALARFSDFAIVVAGALPWWIVIGSDYVHAPFLAIIHASYISDHKWFLLALAGGAVFGNATTLLIWWTKGLLLLQLLLVAILCLVFVGLHQISFGRSWYLTAGCELGILGYYFAVLRHELAE
jgi:hypothetical protein